MDKYALLIINILLFGAITSVVSRINILFKYS